jgi:hypothetical protein
MALSYAPSELDEIRFYPARWAGLSTFAPLAHSGASAAFDEIEALNHRMFGGIAQRADGADGRSHYGPGSQAELPNGSVI